MTEEEKNIKVINNFILYCKGSEERKFTDAELFAAMESISDLIQKQQKEIDLNNEAEIALNNRIMDLEAELKKKDKIIDEMANYISSLDIDEDICSKNKEKNCEEGFESENLGEYCKNCIRQYFERKIEQ